MDNAPVPSGSHHRPISGIKRAAQGSPNRTFEYRLVGPSTHSPTRRPMMPPPTSPQYYPANTSGYIRKRASLPFTQPLAPPHGQRPRISAKQLCRENSQSLSSHVYQHANSETAREVPLSSPASIRSPTRRVIVASSSAGSISAPIPVKRSQPNLPYWQVTDNASARASDGRRVAAMSVGDRSAVSEYRNITDKTYTYPNENVRKEYDLKDDPRHLGRKAARKTEERMHDSDENLSSSDSSSDPSNSDDDWESVPESDQGSESAKGHQPEDDDSVSSVEIIDPAPFRPPIIELLDDTPPESPAQTPRLSEPPEEILAVIERLTLSVTCMQELRRLPFLRRNLREGFSNYCRALGVKTESEDHLPLITVIFKLADAGSLPHEASMTCYECPLCQLHRPFQTKAMLETHLDTDHREVRTSWEELDKKMKIHWRLELLFANTDEEQYMIDTVFKSCTPEPQMATPEKHVTPPPPNPFGPTAQYPFLPAKSEYGGPDLEYSVRFGGPKIYDLLGTLPLEPYGILSWAVLDREEEIFESDDIPDEHKVMHALWARWITLNRRLFVAHFFNGTKLFVDQYWKMIRRAAGWEALRYWLLMLMANRFLTGREVAETLRRYENWCSED